MQRQGPLQISHEKEERTNGAYCSRSHGEYMSNRDDRLLDTLDRKGDIHRYYSSFGSDNHDDQHRYHTYKRSDRGYLSDEFKK